MEDPTGTEKAQLICVNSRGRWSCHLISPAGAAQLTVSRSAAQLVRLGSVTKSNAKLGSSQIAATSCAYLIQWTSTWHLNATGEVTRLHTGATAPL